MEWRFKPGLFDYITRTPVSQARRGRLWSWYRELSCDSQFKHLWECELCRNKFSVAKHNYTLFQALCISQTSWAGRICTYPFSLFYQALLIYMRRSGFIVSVPLLLPSSLQLCRGEILWMCMFNICVCVCAHVFVFVCASDFPCKIQIHILEK